MKMNAESKIRRGGMPRRRERPQEMDAQVFTPRFLGVSASRRSICALLLTALLAIATGCQDDSMGREAQYDYSVGNYPRAERVLKKAATKTDENYVLNNDRLGSVALVNYDLNTAESAFLRSYEVINSANVNDGGRALSAAVVGENNKIWKGEPFERAMVNYYLGLLYYMRGDYNNSRAAFENALFKLRDYGSGDDPKQYSEFESDFSLAYMMLGKCYLHLGQPDKAKNMFDLGVKERPDLANVAQGLSRPSNLLIVADWGWGPVKITTVDHAFAGFGPRPEEAGPIPLPRVYLDGHPAYLSAPPAPLIDLLSLAQDRKWQDIDTIRAIKSVAGKALMGVGAAETLHGSGATGHRYNGNDVAIGLGLIAAGALLDASSQADLRHWEMLPRTVYLIPMQVPPGTHDVTVEFPTGEQQTWHGLVAPAQGEATYYYRMLENAPTDRNWPPGNTTAAEQAN
jgi:tetratricopeptide (TPR) repeat protein